MKKSEKTGRIAAAVAIPLLTGGAAALLSRESFGLYALLANPPLAPPGWVFPVVWTILYILMGLASYLVWSSDASAPRKKRALGLYAAQLALTFFWPLLFFVQGLYTWAFLLLALLWLLVFLCRCVFSCICETAGKLMWPYLLWLSYAAYLNLGVVLLN